MKYRIYRSCPGTVTDPAPLSRFTAVETLNECEVANTVCDGENMRRECEDELRGDRNGIHARRGKRSRRPKYITPPRYTERGDFHGIY